MQNMPGSQWALTDIIYPVFVVGIRIKVARHVPISVDLCTCFSSQQGSSLGTVLSAHMLFVMFDSVQ